MNNQDRFKKIRRGFRMAGWAALMLVGAFAAAWGLFPLPVERLEKDYSTVFLDREGRLVRIELSPSGRYRIRLPLTEVSEEIRRGVVAFEDQWFHWHPGVNPAALVKAALTHVPGRGGRRRGGSTITMQIARMMEPKPRTVVSKSIEIFRACQLEFAYSKDELLERYLNTIPLGGNIEGIGAGAYLYFGKPAHQLSFGEAALLIGLPNAPNRLRPDLHPQAAERQRNRIVEEVGAAVGVSSQGLSAARASKVPTRRMGNPLRMPHLVGRAKAASADFIQALTADSGLQKFCEVLLEDRVGQMHAAGAWNGALMVVNNRTREVKAYVGSPDFFDRDHGGQINGAAIPRSPGSVLKPFLYAAAIDAGRLTPKTMVADIPTEFDRYEPVNYDRRYWGPLQAEEALIHSLNIPAVRLEAAMAGKGLGGVLQQAGLASREEINRAGLAVVLGTHPLTLEEVVSLYVSLANGGRYAPLVFSRESRPGGPERQLWSPEACYLVSEMLANGERPDLPLVWEFTTTHSKVAFKTGTSFGLRDAWCVGYNADYTVGVWIGNVDGASSHALVGMKAAAPIVFEVMNHLGRQAARWISRPNGVAIREVCSRSGQVRGPECPEGLRDDFLPGISSYERCTIHHRITVHRRTGREACHECMSSDQGKYRERVIEEWTSEVERFLREVGRRVAVRPPHDPACPRAASANAQAPMIISPKPGGAYVVTGALSLDHQRILLKVAAAPDARRLYWFCGKRLVAEGRPDEPLFFAPEPGAHRLTVVDARGRSASVSIKILATSKHDSLVQSR